ncbi:putative Cathepsin B [Blattamonas nauphoetae]|uniref:Cathepsin B n=1 Tax=Blattamonas nauphoetae TaxID=2049346 RepID=A0ABQ9YJ48_9EUKA|nr:putative Cathepsin B [Blattamonas nauphoetae]
MISVCLIASFFAASPLVERINNNPANTWKARDYPANIISIAKAKENIKFPETQTAKKSFAPLSTGDFPETFNCGERWPGSIGPVRDVGTCGGSWAFATANVVAARLYTINKGVGPLSPQDLVSCCDDAYGCQGADIEVVWHHLHYGGVTTEECIPWVSGYGRVPLCPAHCKDGSNITRQWVKSYTMIEGGEPAMMKQMMEEGPIVGGFMMFADFLQYTSGIYHYVEGGFIAANTVMIFGWGVENGVKYWNCMNNWGPYWGENGFFRIQRGINTCSIEGLSSAGHFYF